MKIVRTKDNRWGIFAPEQGVVMEPGDLNEMCDQALALGITPAALEMAFNDMFEKGTNCADFGMSLVVPGTFGFIFSENAAIVERRTGAHEILAIKPEQFDNVIAMVGNA